MARIKEVEPTEENIAILRRIFQDIPSQKIRTGEKKKYRPFTHKVIGYERGFLVQRAFKSEAAALKFASTLRDSIIYSMS